jgi:hypothetical protein
VGKADCIDRLRSLIVSRSRASYFVSFFVFQRPFFGRCERGRMPARQEYRRIARCFVGYRHHRSLLTVRFQRATQYGTRADAPVDAVVGHDERRDGLRMQWRSHNLKEAFR